MFVGHSLLSLELQCRLFSAVDRATCHRVGNLHIILQLIPNLFAREEFVNGVARVMLRWTEIPIIPLNLGLRVQPCS